MVVLVVLLAWRLDRFDRPPTELMRGLREVGPVELGGLRLEFERRGKV